MDPQEIQKLVFKYEAKFKKAGASGVEELDSLVHDFKATEASDINNAGIEAQLEYIIGECISKNEAEKTLEKILRLSEIAVALQKAAAEE